MMTRYFIAVDNIGNGRPFVQHYYIGTSLAETISEAAEGVQVVYELREAVRLSDTASSITPDDLLDTDEVANLLGIPAARLRTMRARPGSYRQLDGFPEPLRMISGRPVWDRLAVEKWQKGMAG